MKKINFLLIIGLFLLISCTKDNNYPKKYIRAEFQSGEVRLVTKNGEVKNREEINKFTEKIRNYFLNRENASDYVYSFEDDVNFMTGSEIEIVFTSETKGTIREKSDNHNEYLTTNFNLIRKGDYYIVSLDEVIEHYYYLENPRYKCIPEIIERIPLPLAGEIVKYRKPLYIKKNGDEILVSIVSYMERSYYSDSSFRSISINGAINNLISEDYFNLIQSSNYNPIDSIAFKESYIRFR